MYEQSEMWMGGGPVGGQGKSCIAWATCTPLHIFFFFEKSGRFFYDSKRCTLPRSQDLCRMHAHLAKLLRATSKGQRPSCWYDPFFYFIQLVSHVASSSEIMNKLIFEASAVLVGTEYLKLKIYEWSNHLITHTTTLIRTTFSHPNHHDHRWWLFHYARFC